MRIAGPLRAERNIDYVARTVDVFALHTIVPRGGLGRP